MKMRPMETNRRVLTWFCLHPADENTGIMMKLIYAANAFVALSIAFLFFFGSCYYFGMFASTDLEKALGAVWTINGIMAEIYMFIVMLLSRQKIKSAFDALTEIYEANKNEESFCFLERVNEKCEWLWRIYFKYAVGILVSLSLVTGASMWFCWKSYDSFDAECVFQPAPVILPWNDQTLIGYFWLIVFILLIALFYLLVNGSILLLFLSICLHHQAFSEMFHHTVQKLNHRDKKRDDKEFLCDLIRFHISVKEWFLQTADLFSPSIAFYLIMNMLVLACVVFQFDQQLKHVDYRISSLIFTFLMMTINLFIYCYFGKIATESYKKMATDLYEVNWYELPVKLQKYFILMIANMQRPLHYHGFHIAVLNLETFRKLLNAVYTYYMIFKTITSD